MDETTNAASSEVPLLIDLHGLEIISDGECRELLRHAAIGRVGFTDAGETVILPVNFAWVAGSVLFRTSMGSKLRNAARAHPMSFEIDSWDESSRTGWSVLVKGVSDEVTDEWVVSLSEQLGVDPWAKGIERNDLIRIRADEITGRRIVKQ